MKPLSSFSIYNKQESSRYVAVNWVARRGQPKVSAWIVRDGPELWLLH